MREKRHVYIIIIEHRAISLRQPSLLLGVGGDDIVSGSQQQREHTDNDDDDASSDEVMTEVMTTADVMRRLGLCHGDVNKLCQKHRKSYCSAQQREPLPADRKFDLWPQGVAAALMTSSRHTSSQTRVKRMKTDVMRYLCHDVMSYLCQLANTDLIYCHRHRAEANGETPTTASDVGDDVRAPAADKRYPGGDAMAAIMELCGSEAPAGGSRRSACFDRYLKNFARHITTSGNRFVGR